MDNLTFQEQPFGKFDIKEISDKHYISYDFWGRVIDFLRLFASTMSICASVVLIYVIIKIKRLRSRTNNYILHYAISALIFYTFTTAFEILLHCGLHNLTSGRVFCMLFNIESVCLSLTFTFAAALSVDWLILVTRESWLERYGRIQKYLIVCIYLVHITEYSLVVSSCFDKHIVAENSTTLVIYCLASFTVLSVNAFTYFKKPSGDCIRYRYSLTISTFLVLIWIPVVVFAVFVIQYLYFPENIIIRIFVLPFEILLAVVVHGVPIITAFWLSYISHDFSQAFNTVFKRPSSTPDDLDDDEENALVQSENS
jgi:hypothetical protein